MSDMYLVLRRRLNSVATEWLDIPTDVVKEARKRKGLSYESAARQVPVAAKTWERWEKRGRVPLFHVDKIAQILALEIERPALAPVRLSDGDRLGVLEERVEEVIVLLEEVRAAVLAKPGSKPATRKGTPQARPGS